MELQEFRSQESGVRSQESGAPHELCARGFEKKLLLGGPRELGTIEEGGLSIAPDDAATLCG